MGSRSGDASGPAGRREEHSYCFTGEDCVAAEPGGRLWPVAQVLCVGYARSVQAADTARAELGVAAGAVREGRRVDARRALDVSAAQLPLVEEARGRADLVAWHAQLGAALAERGQR